MKPPGLTVIARGQTDVGMKRRINEDVFVIDDNLGIYLVADGMGGHAAGEVASRLATEGILDYLRRAMGGTGEAGRAPLLEGKTAGELLAAAIVRGHQELCRAVERDPSLKGMGTTVVAAFRPPGLEGLILGHVGDSRAYRFRNGRLQLLTEDHSWVHEQVAAGFLSEEAARRHPLKNVVTQALGGSSEPHVDIRNIDVESGDIFLLCSDGLNSMLTDKEMAGILARGNSLADRLGKLIVAANRKGGNDNITVLLLSAGAG